MSSSTNAATPALAARRASLLSSATALKIASAIGLRQTFTLHTKTTRAGWSALPPSSFNRPLPPLVGPSRAGAVLPSGRAFSVASRIIRAEDLLEELAPTAYGESSARIAHSSSRLRTSYASSEPASPSLGPLAYCHFRPSSGYPSPSDNERFFPSLG